MTRRVLTNTRLSLIVNLAIEAAARAEQLGKKSVRDEYLELAQWATQVYEKRQRKKSPQ